MPDQQVIVDLEAGVAEATTVMESAGLLLDNLGALLTAALTSSTPIPRVQAVIDALAAKKAALAQDIVENTPAAP